MEPRRAGKKIRPVQSDYQQDHKLRQQKQRIQAITENDNCYWYGATSH